ncbi:hypothetical protein J3F83DRAFT_738416 [Trichoderma novae-zelandiae]
MMMPTSHRVLSPACFGWLSGCQRIGPLFCFALISWESMKQHQKGMIFLGGCSEQRFAARPQQTCRMKNEGGEAEPSAILPPRESPIALTFDAALDGGFLWAWHSIPDLWTRSNGHLLESTYWCDSEPLDPSAHVRKSWGRGEPRKRGLLCGRAKRTKHHRCYRFSCMAFYFSRTVTLGKTKREGGVNKGIRCLGQDDDTPTYTHTRTHKPHCSNRRALLCVW